MRITLEDVYLNRLNCYHFFILVGALLLIVADCMIFLSQSLDAIRMSMSAVSFLAKLGPGILFLYNALL